MSYMRYCVDIRRLSNGNTVLTVLETENHEKAWEVVNEYNKEYGYGKVFLKKFPKSEYFIDVFNKEYSKPMNKIEQAEQAFIIVKNILNEKSDTTGRMAYRIAWKKPLKFYREHTTEETIQLLLQEARERLYQN